MILNRMESYADLRTVRDECNKYLYCHIILTMKDGSVFDGIIENVDTDDISMLVGEDMMDKESEDESDEQRQYYNRPRRRYRRFRRRRFPIAKLALLSLLPYVPSIAYPYYPY